MLSLILIATLIATTNAQTCRGDYCSICADHVMCQYPTSDFGAGCGSPVYSGLVCDTEKQVILDAHNNVRRRVAKGLETRGNPGPQPPAANMRSLVWDEELARIAQRWSNQCIFGTARCKNVERFNVADNDFAAGYFPPDPEAEQRWNNTVDQWYRRVDDFDNNNVSPYVPGDADRYTKVVWADTAAVGCGFTGFFDSDGYYIRYYVCNYGPGGNVQDGNSSVYKIGPACSECPAGTTACYDGLCV